jgi:hypothetical protein
MEVNNTMRPNQLFSLIQVDMIKKSQDTVKNIIGSIIENNFENTKKLQEEVAKITGSGGNLNIKA